MDSCRLIVRMTPKKTTKKKLNIDDYYFLQNLCMFCEIHFHLIYTVAQMCGKPLILHKIMYVSVSN